jgi:membrane fusion protein (multidrug efflux system)
MKPSKDSKSDIFRQEAVEGYLKNRDSGDLVRISPGWTSTIYWILVLAVLVGLVLSSIFRLHEYASGPAVILAGDHIILTAPGPGAVESVEVSPGEYITKNRILIHINAESVRDTIGILKLEFDATLNRIMRDPGDQSARNELAGIGAELGIAEKRLERYLVRSPNDGYARDIRVRQGQVLTEGDPLLLIVNQDRASRLAAFIPGRYQAALKPGLTLKLEIAGYPQASESFTIESIDKNLTSAAEARSLLGTDFDVASLPEGAMVKVYADLDSETFISGGEEHRYTAGLTGFAEVSIRDEPVLFALIPRLKSIIEKLRNGAS